MCGKIVNQGKLNRQGTPPRHTHTPQVTKIAELPVTIRSIAEKSSSAGIKSRRDRLKRVLKELAQRTHTVRRLNYSAQRQQPIELLFK